MYTFLLLLMVSLPDGKLPDALPDAKLPTVTHIDQPTVKPATIPLIQGVPFDKRLEGPTNWFRCPWCSSSTDLMFLGEHLKTHGVTDVELNQVGYRRWTILHDNIHNKDWKPPTGTKAVPQSTGCSEGTAKPSGCEGGSCQQTGPVRFLFGRRR